VQARLECHIAAAGFKFQAQLCGQRTNEIFVVVRRGSPQLMMKMKHAKRDALRRAQFRKNAQHGHGIGAAGNSQSDPIAGPNHAVALHGFQDAFLKVIFHAAKLSRRKRRAGQARRLKIHRVQRW
jgi:hypothetical protein